MLHAKGKSCINNSSDDFCIIGKEKDQYLLRLKENIFIEHFEPSLKKRRTMLDWFYLCNDIMVNCVKKSNLAVFDLCV